MTNEELAALDRAATQGVLFAQTPSTEDDFGVPIIATDNPPDRTPTNGMVLWGTMMPTEIEALDTKRAEANAAFTVALWNLYRTGKLVLIDDGAVEALRANKQGWENCVEMGLLPLQHHDTARALIEQCRAALFALGVK